MTTATILGSLSVAAAAALAAAWNQLTALARRLSAVGTVAIELSPQAATTVHAYCAATMRRSRLSPVGVHGATWHHPSRGGHFLLPVLTLGATPQTFYQGWRPWTLTIGRLSCPRGAGDPRRLVTEAMRWFNAARRADREQEVSRFAVYRKAGRPRHRGDHGRGNDYTVGAAPADPGVRAIATLDDPVPGITPLLCDSWADLAADASAPRGALLARMSLSPAAEAFVTEAGRWRRSRDWFGARELPWKMGALLHGPPGTGKTTMAAALAQAHGDPLWVLQLSDMTSHDFREAWECAAQTAPCVVALEDFDATFDGRKNVAYPDGGVTFDCLLNTIDGAQAAPGVLLVVTTNRLECIDEALGRPRPDGQPGSTRPGRIHRCVHLAGLDVAGRRKLANRVLLGLEDRVEPLVALGLNDTPAQFQDRCVQAALAHYWGVEGPTAAPCALHHHLAASPNGA